MKRVGDSRKGPEEDMYVVQFFDGDFQPTTLRSKIFTFPQNFLDSPGMNVH